MAPPWLPAVLVTALLGGASGADSVTQSEDNAVISQGDPLQLNCTYKLPGSPYLFWYVQYPGQGLRMLLRDLGGQDSDEGTRKGFGATHDKENKSFHLRKASVELNDAATYYCAGSDTVTRASIRAAQKPRRGCVDRGGGGGGERESGISRETETSNSAPSPSFSISEIMAIVIILLGRLKIMKEPLLH